MFSSLEAAAQLVPAGGTPAAPIALHAGDDGASFSGFLGAAPGDYTLEIAFTGAYGSSADRWFLGRWTSNAFTVVKGHTVMALFDGPLDAIGRPEDHGDDDKDGLGVLDELLFGSNPRLPDTDGDGLLDGKDCFPADASKTFAVLEGGSLEDCDADRSLRADLSFGARGDDCDDLDPARHPGATDACGDGVDEDCNPATCPDDSTGGRPQITVLAPDEGATVGCQMRISARITGDRPITRAEVLFIGSGSPPQIEDTIAMQALSGDRYETPEFQDATMHWLTSGVQGYVVRATNDSGKTSTVSRTLRFELDVPTATISPATLGPVSAPFMVDVVAGAPSGVSSIALMRAPRPTGMDVDRSMETMVAAVNGGHGSWQIDPTMLANGEYVLYPVVEDSVGNVLEPSKTFSIDQRADGAYITGAAYLCTYAGSNQTLPVLSFEIGPPRVAAAKMRDHLSEALAIAAMRDPMAGLVEIRGFGPESDGRVRLDLAASGEGKWWRYEFFNFTDNRHIQVTWYSAYYSTPNPEVVVEENSPFGFSYHDFMHAPSALADSDEAARVYQMSAGCPPLTGDMNDSLRYESDQPFTPNDVARFDVGTKTWKGSATSPVTQLSACQ
jgi:putative metal-binding protein